MFRPNRAKSPALHDCPVPQRTKMTPIVPAAEHRLSWGPNRLRDRCDKCRVASEEARLVRFNPSLSDAEDSTGLRIKVVGHLPPVVGSGRLLSPDELNCHPATTLTHRRRHRFGPRHFRWPEQQGASAVSKTERPAACWRRGSGNRLTRRHQDERGKHHRSSIHPQAPPPASSSSVSCTQAKDTQSLKLGFSRTIAQMS